MKINETFVNLSGWNKVMNNKIILSLALTLLLTTIGSAATWNVPENGNIQTVIDNASSGDTILLADGTYTGAGKKDLDFGGGKNLQIESASGNPRNCIIDLQGSGRAFYLRNGQEASTIRGITIKNGDISDEASDGTSLKGGPYGGAIECLGTSPTIENCIFEDCEAEYGGAIDIFYGSPIIKNCIFTGNKSAYEGSAIEIAGESETKIQNCLFYNNTAASGYGTVDCYEGASPEITNCTIADNSGAENYGGVYSSGSNVIITNTILWNNGVSLGGMLIEASYSCVENGYSGAGNISTDPLFRTGPYGPYGNYYLSQISAGQLVTSDCINSGGSDEIGLSTLTTNTYNNLLDESTVDIGYHYPASATTGQFDLTTVVEGGGIVTNYPTGQTHKQYGEVRLSAIAYEGFRFMEWVIGSTTIPGPNNIYVVTMDANTTVTARFSTVQTYKLITLVKGGNGNITGVTPNYYPDPSDPFAYYIPMNTNAIITAAPNIGYEIKQWLSGPTETFNINDPATYDVNAPTGNTFTKTIDANTTVAVEFKYQQYMLTTSVVNGNGTVTPKRGYYPAGATVNLVATPADGYRVKDWTVDGILMNKWNTPTHSVVMTANKNVQVEFELSTNRVIHVPGTYPYVTIQDAINNSQNGDTIKIAPGTYPGTGFSVNKSITIVGEPQNPETVVIDGNNFDNRIFNLGNAGVVTLNGLTIANAKYYGRTPLQTESPWDPNTNFRNDGANGNRRQGAGIFVDGNHKIINCIIRNCIVTGGDARDGFDGNPFDISKHDLPIHKGGFGGRGGNAEGAGIYIFSGNPTIKNTIVDGCRALGGNGGDGGNGLDASTNDPFDPNFPGGPGGNGGNGGDALGAGIYCRQGSNPTFISCTVENCEVFSGYGGDGGLGGVGARSDQNAFDPCNPAIFIQTGYGQGGHAGMPGLAYGGGIYIDDLCTAKFESCKIIENSALGNVGGSGGNSSGDLIHSFYQGQGGVGALVDIDTLDRIIQSSIWDANNVSNGAIDPNNLILPNQVHIDGSFPMGMTLMQIYLQIIPISPEVYTAKGGGIYIGGFDAYLANVSAGRTTADFNNCEIIDNQTKGSTSGLGGYNIGNLFSHHNSNFEYPSRHYRIPSYGNGVYLADNSTATFLNSNVEGNYYTIEETQDIFPLAHDEFIVNNQPVAGHPGTDLSIYNLIYGDEYVNYGGGLSSDSFNWNTQVTIKDSNIADNNSAFGGGIFADTMELHVLNSEISNNRSFSGGGIAVNDSFGDVINSIVKGNSAGTVVMDINQQSDYALSGTGGGIYALSSLLNIQDSYVTENSAVLTGGGICIDGDWWMQPTLKPVIKNCLVTKNSAMQEGGGIAAIYFAKPTIQNCSIVQNQTIDINSTGSGIFATYSADVKVSDSILWDNGLGASGVLGSQIALSDGASDMPSSLKISYSDIQTSTTAVDLAMDVVILIDTTGSMGGVLDSVKEAAGDVVDKISQKTSDYRIAVVNFRDNPDDVHGQSGLDYLYYDDLVFTRSKSAVQNAINGITIGFGIDPPESVYSALMHCIDGNSLGNWRTEPDVKKLIILMGDAPGHDPCEPWGDNYSLDNVVDAANGKNINIYSILTGFGVGNQQATQCYSNLAQGTNGVLIESSDDSQAAAAVIRAIELAMLPSTFVHLDDPRCSIIGVSQDINGTWSVEGSSNISSDPLFVSGYYLSNFATENLFHSPCIDAGSTLASNLGMDTYTTRLDGLFDSGLVDMGYHYKQGVSQYNVNVTIVPDSNVPGIHGYVTAEPNLLASYNPATLTYTYQVYEGTSLELTAVADANYYIRGWYDQSNNLISQSEKLVVDANSDRTIYVRFKPVRTISVSGGGTALQTAVENAENGDMLIVSAGTYSGDIEIGGKAIKLYGTKPDNQGVVGKTVIDCSAGLRGFIFSGGETNSTVLNGFTIINGGGDVNDIVQGGAILINSNSSPTIVNVDIIDCTVRNANGGAIYINTNSHPQFRKVNITNSVSQNGNGGGVYISNNSNPIFTDCKFTDCFAGLRGGAVYNSTENATTFTDCTFTANRAGTSAGAIYWGELCNPNITGCKFSSNSAQQDAGAIMFAADCGFDISGCTFTSNTANGIGGAVYLSENCDGRIINCNMTNNIAQEDGGAIYVIDSGDVEISECQITSNTALRGGGIFAISAPDLRIDNCEITGNKAYGSTTYRTDPNDPNSVITEELVAQGGGIFAFASIEKIEHCTITSNTAITSGGGIYIAGEHPDVNSPQIFNCLIDKNKASADGGGVSVNWFATAKIQNCTISKNIVTNIDGNGGGLYCSYEGQAFVKDSIIWGNTGIEGSQIAVGSGDTAYPLRGYVHLSHSDVSLKTEASFTSISSGSGTSVNIAGPVLVDQDTIFNEINATGSAKVIVSLTEPSNKYKIKDWSSPTLVNPLRAEISTRQTQVLSTLNTSEFILRHKLVNTASFSGTVTQSGLTKLLTNPLVEHIEPVRIAYPMLAQAIPMGNAFVTRSLYNGSGISIAIVDTGVDYTHPRLGGPSFPNSKIIGGYDTCDNDANPMPVEGILYSDGYGVGAHGTNCSGIAAGLLGTVGDYIGGVAYNAKLYALKATSNSDPGQGFPDDATLAAWDWCVTHQNDNTAYPILVISNSWGIKNYPINSAAEADALFPSHARAAQTAVNAGITILAASGNDGFAGQGISWPSAMSNIISVGAVYDTTAKVTDYSNTSAILDIFAPADPVYTTDIMGDVGYDGDYYPYFNGTSSACPFAAGVVAALQSAAIANTGSALSPQDIESILKDTGTPVTDSKVSITKPMVNLAAAIALLSESTPIYVEPGCTLEGFVNTLDGWVTDANYNNYDEDPNFVFGYYLSHVDAGQDYNSPLFDKGSMLAAALGLDILTTRTDDVNDTNTVDLGYHYSMGVKRFHLHIDVNTVDANAGGTTIPAPGDYNEYIGTIRKIEAVPGPNSRVSKWIIDGVSIPTHDRFYSITMDRDHNVTVQFEFYTPRNIIVPDQYETIQEAIDAAEDGDTVYIYKKSDGKPHYITDIDGLDFKGKAIRIRSENPDDPNIVAETIIDCNNRGRAFIFQNGEDSNTIIEGLTIINGLASGPIATGTTPVYDSADANIVYYNGNSASGDGFGGGIYIDANASPVIRKCVFTNCQATGGWGADGGRGYNLWTGSQLERGGRGGDGGDGSGNGFGGAIFCHTNTAPKILDCTFVNNIARGGLGGDGGDGGNAISGKTAGDGGDGGNGYGNGYGGSVYFSEGSFAKIIGCSFSGSSANIGAGGLGGVKGMGQVPSQGPYPYDGITGNSSGTGFGGVIYYEEATIADINDCEFIDNTAVATTGNTLGTGGGAIYFEPNCVNINIINSNMAGNRTTAGNGGAILLNAKNKLTLDNCYIGGNYANVNGGGIYSGSRVDANENILTFNNCAFTGNRANESGGGIFAKNTDASFVDCYINRNTAHFGGGINFVADSKLVVIGGTFIENKAIGNEADGGGALMLHVPAEFINCQFISNTSEYGGGGLMMKGPETAGSRIHNCLFAKNIANVRGGAVLLVSYASPEITSCTFSQNQTEVGGLGGGIFCTYSSSPMIRDCIFDQTKRIAIYENSVDSDPTINYCFFNGNFDGDFYDFDTRLYNTCKAADKNAEIAALNAVPGNGHNLKSDIDITDVLGKSIFRTGALGDYYLKQHAADSADQDIPAIDAGSDLAKKVPVPYDTNMGDYTTRIDSVLPDLPDRLTNPDHCTYDQGKLDIGFHYKDPDYVAKFHLITSVIGGHGNIEPDSNDFYAGTTVQLTATPDTGWRVKQWSGTDDDSTTNTTNYVVMMSDKNVTVKYEQPKDIFVPAEYTTLQEAINDAKSGDKIIVASGTYQFADTNFDYGFVTIWGKNITITSTNPDDPCVVAATVFVSSPFYIANVDETMILDGITLRDVRFGGSNGRCPPSPISPDGVNGVSHLGGAMMIYNASPTIRNVRFVNCSTFGGNGTNNCSTGGDGGWGGFAQGGAVGISSGNPTFKNCQFINCYAEGGNGGDGDTSQQTPGHGGSWGDPNGSVWHTWDNGDGRGPNGGYAPYWFYSGYGGAVYCSTGTKPVFEKCLFSGNRTIGGVCGIGYPYMEWPRHKYVIDSFGGAVYMATGSEAKFTDCNFVDNFADTRNQIGDANMAYGTDQDGWTLSDPVVSYGGAICAEGTAIPVVKNCKFTNNVACAGGAMYWEDSIAHISNSTFIGGSAMLGGAMLLVDSNSAIAECEFIGNRAVSPAGQGGAIYSASSQSMFYDCLIMNNGASVSGGGAYFSGEFEPNMHNCLITGNTANRDGGGISANWDAQLTLSNCTLANNEVTGGGFAAGFGGGLSCAYEANTKVINSILWNNNAEYGREIAIGNNFDAADKRAAEVTVLYSDVQGGGAGVFFDQTSECKLYGFDLPTTNLDGTSMTSPSFVSKLAWGEYFLGATDINELPDQPVPQNLCIDFGDGTALANQMFKHTTRTDLKLDVADSNVDLGYHYTREAGILGDFDFDGDVDLPDFLAFLDYWMHGNCTFPYYCGGRDFTEDGEVDFEDYALFAMNYMDTEKLAPTPNPMMWDIAPRSSSLTSIMMKAVDAKENSGSPVEYYFECVSGGGNSRGWDSNSTYTDTGLTTNLQYGYRVKARDGNGNETGWSKIGYAIAGADTTPPTPNPMTWLVDPHATSSNSSEMACTVATDIAGVEYYFEERSGNQGGTSSGWIETNVYVDTGLQPETTYTYRVKARDKSDNHNDTDWSSEISVTTPAEGEEPNDPNDPNSGDILPPEPNPSQWSVTPRVTTDGLFFYHTMTAVEATDLSPPVQYEFACVDGGGTSSGWIYTNTYTAGGFWATTNSAYRVRTKDAAGNIGQWSVRWHTYYGQQ
ncbi:MAG: hypothetical protein A2Y10_15890 [Planctomycetes bacterium GWF2_41_51]|nr:MAG: hypothetical protein A2Y10_15890 [Planctomycetes bacterium GWF2_41_51]